LNFDWGSTPDPVGSSQRLHRPLAELEVKGRRVEKGRKAKEERRRGRGGEGKDDSCSLGSTPLYQLMFFILTGCTVSVSLSCDDEIYSFRSISVVVNST